jgi:beta-phosphoglucomutase
MNTDNAPTRLAPGLALIFDMDGVVIDSNRIHREVWVEFNRRHGVQTTPEMLEWMYGKRNDQIVREFFGDALAPEECTRRGADKERLYRETIIGRVEDILVPGVKDFLRLYQSYPVALATNAEAANVEFVLAEAGLRPCFRAVVHGGEVQHPKPHPEVYLRAAALLGIEPQNCIVFEDSMTGVEAAGAAGMRVIGICTTHGYLPGTSITVHNFKSRSLHSWVAAQEVANRA